MKKLLVLALIGGAAWLSAQERAGPSASDLAASFAWWADVLGPRLQPFLDPVLRWSARDELRALARDLQKRQASLQPLPHPNRFRDHIRQNLFSGRDGLDPWGNEYYLVITLDSIIVGSPGPDGVRDPDSDLRIAWPRDLSADAPRSAWRRIIP